MSLMKANEENGSYMGKPGTPIVAGHNAFKEEKPMPEASGTKTPGKLEIEKWTVPLNLKDTLEYAVERKVEHISNGRKIQNIWCWYGYSTVDDTVRQKYSLFHSASK